MKDINPEQKYLKAIIDRFENKIAIIKTQDGQELHWPIKNLPDDCQQGSALRIILSTSQTDQQEREKIAKTILNQLLKQGDEDLERSLKKNGDKNK
jgi:transcription elongation factor